MSQLKLEHLRTFLAVARFGSIKRAADRMNLTQPAVTSRIKSLEETLGVTLFERMPKGMRLTKRGDLLVHYAEQFQHLSDLVDENVGDVAGADRHLRLGVSETIAQSWLPEFVAALHEAYPRLKIEISVDISVNLRAQLLDREVDLAILLGPVSDYTVDNVGLPEFELAWFRAAAPDPTPPVDFTRTPVITYARNTRPYRELQAELFARHGPEAVLFPSSSLSSCFRLVEAGLGVGALPRTLGEDLVQAGRITPFDPGWTPAPLRFTASFLGDPRSHLSAATAQLALRTARSWHNENL